MNQSINQLINQSMRIITPTFQRKRSQAPPVGEATVEREELRGEWGGARRRWAGASSGPAPRPRPAVSRPRGSDLAAAQLRQEAGGAERTPRDERSAGRSLQ